MELVIGNFYTKTLEIAFPSYHDARERRWGDEGWRNASNPRHRLAYDLYNGELVFCNETHGASKELKNPLLSKDSSVSLMFSRETQNPYLDFRIQSSIFLNAH